MKSLVESIAGSNAVIKGTVTLSSDTGAYSQFDPKTGNIDSRMDFTYTINGWCPLEFFIFLKCVATGEAPTVDNYKIEIDKIEKDDYMKGDFHQVLGLYDSIFPTFYSKIVADIEKEFEEDIKVRCNIDRKQFEKQIEKELKSIK